MIREIEYNSIEIIPSNSRQGFEVAVFNKTNINQSNKNKSKNEDLNSGYFLIRLPKYQIQGKESDVNKAINIINDFTFSISQGKSEKIHSAYIYDTLETMKNKCKKLKRMGLDLVWVFFNYTLN